MKKLILLIFTLFLTLNIYSSYHDVKVNSALGLSDSGLALSEGFSNIIKNPTNTYFLKQKGFYISNTISDDYTNIIAGVASYIQYLRSDLSLLFLGQNLMISFNYKFDLQRDKNQISSEYATYSLKALLALKLGFNFGFLDHFAFSIFIEGGNERQYKDIRVREAYVFYDMLSSLKNKLSKTNDIFNLGLGFSLDYDWIAFSILTNKVLALEKPGEDYLLNANYILDGLSLGLSFKTNKYTIDDELALFRFLFNLDFTNVGSPLDRAIRTSMQFNFQLSDEYILYFQVGYREFKRDFKKFFIFDKKSTKASIAIGSKLKDFNLYIALDIPFDYTDRGLRAYLSLDYSYDRF